MCWSYDLIRLSLCYLQYHSPNHSHEGRQKTENPALQKGLGAITSSLTFIGGTIGNALEVSLEVNLGGSFGSM